MRNILFIIAIMLCAGKAHAQNCALGASPSLSTLNTALGYAHNGTCTGTSSANLVTGSGTTAIGTSTVTIPCNASISGPVHTYSQTANQTWTFTGSTSNTGWGFKTTAGCSQVGGQNQSIQWIEWNGQQPSNGGGGLDIVAGTTNFDVLNNYWHGNNSPGNGYNQGPTDLIFFNGGSSSTASSNINVLYNIFGVATFSDCATAMNNTSSPENDNGGGCGGVGFQNNLTNVTVNNNIFHFEEEPLKFFEGNGSVSNLVIDYNAISNYSRIGYETQANISTQGMYFQYNWVGPRYSSNVASFALSMANGCGNALSSTCYTHSDYNVITESDSTSSDTGVFEIWGESSANPPSGTASTTANYNWIQGYAYNGIQWSTSGNFQFNDNAFNIVIGTTSMSTNCTTGTNGNGWWKHETNNPNAYTPSCSGNTYVTSPTTGATGTTASALPSVSPGGGSVTSGTVVTISTTGTNRDTNTSNWCTTDGSTPAPGSGTSTIMTSYTVTGAVTLKCVGMWGAANQPYSHPSGYGYVPSSVLTNSYTTSGSPSVATPVISPTTSSYYMPFTATITDSTPASSIFYTTDGSTPTTGSTPYTSPISVSATTTTVKAIASASGYTNSAVASATYTYSPPALLGCYQTNNIGGSSVNTLPNGSVYQQHVECAYNADPDVGAMQCDGTADSYGSIVTAWGVTTGNISVGAVGAGTTCTTGTQGAGCVKALSVASPAGNTTASVSQNGGTAIACSQWTWYVTTPTLGSPSGVSAIVIQ